MKSAFLLSHSMITLPLPLCPRSVSATLYPALCSWRLTNLDWISWVPLPSRFWMDSANGGTWQDVRAEVRKGCRQWLHGSAHMESASKHPSTKGTFAGWDLVTPAHLPLSRPARGTDFLLLLPWCLRCLTVLCGFLCPCPGPGKESLCKEFHPLGETPSVCHLF